MLIFYRLSEESEMGKENSEKGNFRTHSIQFSSFPNSIHRDGRYKAGARGLEQEGWSKEVLLIAAT